MSTPGNPAHELARKQKRLLYWRETLNANSVSGDFSRLKELLGDYAKLLNKLGVEPTPECWTRAKSMETEFSLAFSGSKLETRRSEVLPEAK